MVNSELRKTSKYFLPRVTSFHDLLNLHLESSHFATQSNFTIAFDPMNSQNSILDSRHIVILQENNAVSVLNNSRGVTSKEILDGICGA